MLSWWADAAAELLTGSVGPISVDFMDGPFRARLRLHDGYAWDIDLVERGRRLLVLRGALVDGRLLAKSIASASERVLALCLKNGWQSSDTARLEEALRKLKASIPK